MSHSNAPLTPVGRLVLVARIQAGMPQAHVAAQMGVAGLQWLSGGIAGKLKVTLVWWIGLQSLTGHRGVLVLRLRLGCVSCVVKSVGSLFV